MSAYDPDFAHRRVSEDYLIVLTEAWLRDVALRWKSAVPPAVAELQAIGLADHLRGGTTRTEVRLGRAPVR